MNCESCQHSNFIGTDYLECRKRAPSMTGSIIGNAKAVFPYVKKTQYCGEFEESAARRAEHQAAIKTLEHLGYTYLGGELWKPPLVKRDCWCLTCRPIDYTDLGSVRMAVCPECGNKRCPRANNHLNACTGSNDPCQDSITKPAPALVESAHKATDSVAKSDLTAHAAYAAGRADRDEELRVGGVAYPVGHDDPGCVYDIDDMREYGDRRVADMEGRKDAAYLERNKVVAALAKCFPSGTARTAIEGWSEDWHGCVYIDLPTGQVSWHFHDSQEYLFDGLPPYDKPWDGHDTEEKYRRVAALGLNSTERANTSPAAINSGAQAARPVPQCTRSHPHEHMDGYCELRTEIARLTNENARLKATQQVEPFQQRVLPWLHSCFGATIAADKSERNHRFLEESLELVQACGCTQSEAHQLVDYVFDRPVGETQQEVGGVMVTLAALCLAQQIDMHACGETELARIWTKVEAIRAKQAAKPKHSPLPVVQHVSLTAERANTLAAIDVADRLRHALSNALQHAPKEIWPKWLAVRDECDAELTELREGCKAFTNFMLAGIERKKPDDTEGGAV